MIGLDTSAIIDLFKGDESLKKLLRNLRQDLALTQLSYLELMFGLDFDNKNHKIEEEYYDEFFASFSTLPLDLNSCKNASKIFWRLKKQGKIIDKFDCVIASILLMNGVNKIITKNIKHFEKILELEVITY